MKTHSLRLGQCSTRQNALFKIAAWAKKAKSFTILYIKRYNYSVATHRKNYFDVEIQYFSTAKEGKYKMPDKGISYFDGERIKT